MEITGIDALRVAKDLLGSQRALAEAVGIKQPSVHEILNYGKKVPAEWCLPIERATEGRVTRHQLRPDLYPPEEQKERVDA